MSDDWSAACKPILLSAAWNFSEQQTSALEDYCLDFGH